MEAGGGLLYWTLSSSFGRTWFSLHSNIDVGVIAKIDFLGPHFPALRSISLGCILFNEETHVEDFIVRHRRTLRSLWLHSCRIAIHGPGQGPPRFWSEVFTRFADVLEELTGVFVDDGRHRQLNRYTRLHERTRYAYLLDSLVRIKDEEALRKIEDEVFSRDVWRPNWWFMKNRIYIRLGETASKSK
ncbi:hypothetical protein HETIRDRAFT_452132 [Heterobasidion irregulare TC 32-1]|uniref:Uncharacterized protein n=1 Tax=Heterobasidion irregulare (strain TC 32-1) TaxID=747525 RepID=W4K669_HETIT|nr:uncharacterized protein HETIRDRAFT_452132 [Heterobasidion irregulare TC 32-1]ETW80566.1 hypothetical protein HETIRDRAFT_452132 [Heterobasidion irregulare TC 32-1]